VKKVTDIVAEIAAASEEQSAGIEQVNNAVSQMDNVTQQNAALVEEASAASKAMEQQSSTLVTQIGYFRSRALAAAAQPSVEIVRSQASTAVFTPKRPAAKLGTRSDSAHGAARPAPLARASGDDSSWSEF